MSDQHMQLARDVGIEALRASPPVGILAITLNQWVMVATITYIALQAAFLVWKWRHLIQNSRTPMDDD